MPSERTHTQPPYGGCMEMPDQPTPRLSGAEMISAERIRQVTAEGWTPEHDDQHTQHELVYAAARYALPHDAPQIAGLWPWDPHWYKPTPNDRVAELTKAGALIAAEIDRLNRDKATR